MGSSCEPNGPTVGGLVWVRRRNGTWWPGQILGLDELQESCVVYSKRTGTPVKLLGREDAIVDWYNLEKSKRVKAFRCGEYDQIIENAIFMANISGKKVARYARREDAILQALEIETSQLSKTNNSESISQTDKTENIPNKLSGLDFISVSPQELSRTAATADNSLEGTKQHAVIDSEDDGTEGGKKRMRGLQDLGVGRALSSYKKKRTRVAHIRGFLKKKDRRRQLKKVLKKTEMINIPVVCEEVMCLSGAGTSNANVRGLEYNGLKGSFSDSTGNITNNIKARSTGRLFDVPFVQEEKQAAGCFPALAPEAGQVSTLPQSGRSSLVETLSVGPDEFQESGSISSGADISHIIDDNGSSKWQHKGKRKSRNKSKTKSFLTPDYEPREVNNMTVVTGPQRSMTIHKALDHAYKRTDNGCLYDVNIDVKMGTFPQHLPYTSLLSKLMGQPVTGHALEVEVVNDAVSDILLNSSSCKLGGVNRDVKIVSKKVRKKGLLSNKKTRKLSTLTGSNIKPDLACVPLKIVFGRIHAALGISSADVGLTR